MNMLLLAILLFMVGSLLCAIGIIMICNTIKLQQQNLKNVACGIYVFVLGIVGYVLGVIAIIYR